MQLHPQNTTSTAVGECRTTRATASSVRASRRAYFRVEGRLPIRMTRLSPEEVDQAIFELASPSALVAPPNEPDEELPLLGRLRRLEEKLDLLLGHSGIDVPKPLGVADLRTLIFSGAGLATEVEWGFSKGEAFRVEILLPSPYARLVRAVGEAVEDSPDSIRVEAPNRLALALRHMHDEERDALVAYSYDLQRIALRAARTGQGRST